MIPDDFLDLIKDENFGNLATINPDGTPQVTTIWVDYDGEGNILFNTARGRVKERNISNDPNVALSIFDMDNPYRSMTVQGKVVELTEDGAVDHIHSLAQKYMKKEKYPLQDGEVRVKVKIKPEKVSTMN